MLLLFQTRNKRDSTFRGQYGLNAGVAIMPPPGFTFANLSLNYSADALKDSRGTALPVKGTYSFWLVENLFLYSPAHKFLGARLSSFAMVNWANGSLTADLQNSQFGLNAGGVGLTDTWVQPVNFGWEEAQTSSLKCSCTPRTTNRAEPFGRLVFRSRSI